MKRILTWVLAAMMILSLAACGNDQGSGSQTAPGQSNSASTETGGSGSTSGDAANGNTGSSMTGGSGSSEGGMTAGGSGSNDTLGDALFGDSESGAAAGGSDTGTTGAMGASYQQMLRNARVHDTDGDLSDLENDYTPGSLGW